MTTIGPDRIDRVPVRRRRMERGERQEAILVAAMDVFAALDPATVNVDLVAAEAGVSRALVYEYFGDRANLVNEVRRRFVREFVAGLDAALGSASSARELLVSFVRAHLEFARRGVGAYRFATEDSSRGVAWLSAYFGGTPEAVLVATTAEHGLRAFVTRWAADPRPDLDGAAELIVAFLNGGLLAVRPLGIKAPKSAGAELDGEPCV